MVSGFHGRRSGGPVSTTLYKATLLEESRKWKVKATTTRTKTHEAKQREPVGDLIVIYSLSADRDRTLTKYAATVPSTSIVDRKRSRNKREASGSNNKTNTSGSLT